VIRAAVRFVLALLLSVLAVRYLWPGGQHLVPAAAAFFLMFTFLLDSWLPRPAVPAAAAPPPRPPRWRAAQTALVVVAAAGAGLLMRHQLGGSVRVVSTSMLPTVLPGDYLLLRRQDAAARPPRRGDVVVFRASGLEEGPSDLVKRVIGLPGDEITMDGGRPIINGEPVPSCDAGAFVFFSREKFTRGRLAVETVDGQHYLAVHEPGAPSFVRYRVRPGEVFVLGDNRGLSNDSRSWNDQRGRGVPLAAIEGRVARVLIGRQRDGRTDLGRLLHPLGIQVHLPGLDLAGLRAGIERCVATRS
jgi:signal peptidase I